MNLVQEMRILHLVSAVLEKMAAGKDEVEVSRAVSALNDRFRDCEKILDSLPAGDLTHADQLALLEKLQTRLKATK